MNKDELKKAFDAGREKEYHYDKSGIDTGYYIKWDSFEDWYNTVLPQANIIKSVCECENPKWGEDGDCEEICRNCGKPKEL